MKNLFTMVQWGFIVTVYSIEWGYITDYLHYQLIISNGNQRVVVKLIVEYIHYAWYILETWVVVCPACIFLTSLKTWYGSIWSLLHCSSRIVAKCLHGLFLSSGWFSYLIGNILFLSLGVILVLLIIGVITRRNTFLWIWDSKVAIRRSLFVSTLISPSPEMSDSEVLHEL